MARDPRLSATQYEALARESLARFRLDHEPLPALGGRRRLVVHDVVDGVGGLAVPGDPPDPPEEKKYTCNMPLLRMTAHVWGIC